MKKVYSIICIYFFLSSMSAFAESYILCDMTITQRLPQYAPPVSTQKGFDISKDSYIMQNNKSYILRISDTNINIHECEHQGNSLWVNIYDIDRFSGTIEGSMSFVPNCQDLKKVLSTNEGKYYTITGICKPVGNKRF